MSEYKLTKGYLKPGKEVKTLKGNKKCKYTFIVDIYVFGKKLRSIKFKRLVKSAKK